MTAAAPGLHAARGAAGGAPGKGRRHPLTRAVLQGGSVATLLGLFSLLAVAAASLSGCAAPEPEDGFVVDVDADSVRVRGAAGDAATAPDGRKYQFRAVCIEAGHPGGRLVLSKWVDDIAVVRDLGQYHGDWKAKGHRWHVERRIEHPAGP